MNRAPGASVATRRNPRSPVDPAVRAMAKKGTLVVTNAASRRSRRPLSNQTLPRKRDGEIGLFPRRASKAAWLGGGLYGEVFRVVVTPPLFAYLVRLAMEGSFRVVDRLPCLGETVAIKVQTFGLDDEDELEIAVREAAVHQLVSGVKKGPAVSGRCVSLTSPRVPPFYMSAGAVMPSKDKVQVVTVMGSVAGAPVMSEAGWRVQAPKTAEMYVAVEKAVAALWMAGVAHADLHMGNVLYDAATKNATVIDFGYAVELPDAARAALPKALGSAIERGAASLSAAWRPKKEGGVGLRLYMNAVLAQRGWKEYNPDDRGLEWLWTQLPPTERTRVPVVRRRAWGCAASGTQRARSPSANARNAATTNRRRPRRP